MTPERRIVILERRLEMTNRNWMRAARKALDGDLRDLRIRVRLFAGAREIAVLSEAEPTGEE